MDIHQAHTVQTNLTVVVRKSHFISRSVENNRSAGADDTGSVAKILSSVSTAGKISGRQSL